MAAAFAALLRRLERAGVGAVAPACGLATLAGLLQDLGPGRAPGDARAGSRQPFVQAHLDGVARPCPSCWRRCLTRRPPLQRLRARASARGRGQDHRALWRQPAARQLAGVPSARTQGGWLGAAGADAGHARTVGVPPRRARLYDCMFAGKVHALGGYFICPSARQVYMSLWQGRCMPLPFACSSTTSCQRRTRLCCGRMRRLSPAVTRPASAIRQGCTSDSHAPDRQN